jgi:ribosomal protein L21
MYHRTCYNSFRSTTTGTTVREAVTRTTSRRCNRIQQQQQPLAGVAGLLSSTTTIGERQRAFFGTTAASWSSSSTRFAVVRHDHEYDNAMQGLHGQQLALAKREGEGKDEPDFDPFIEEELAEARRLAEQEAAVLAATKDDDDDDDPTTTTKEVEEDDEERSSSSTTTSGLYFSQFDYTKYTSDGFLRRNASERAILQAGAPAGGQVAVIPLAGTQFKVTVDDLLIVNRLAAPPNNMANHNHHNDVSSSSYYYSIGSTHTIDTVLLVSNTAVTLVGMPYVAGATVDFMVEEITRDAKLNIFKRRKKGLRRKTGFRRDVSLVRILNIAMPAPYAQIPYILRPEPAPLVDHRRRRFVETIAPESEITTS